MCCLRKAAANGIFIPWEYLYADFAVTGLDASRQGYSSYKQVLSDSSQFIELTLIDDFSRASRDSLEWWRLAQLSRSLRKGMLGASDGFDLNQSEWEIHVTIFGLIQKLFIKSLKEKVSRGLQGAARRGTCTGNLPLGFTRKARLDAHRNPALSPDGQPIYEPCIDPETAHYRLLAFQLFVEQNWSINQIVRHFNAHSMADWNRWTAKGLQHILSSETAIGVFVWNRSRQELDIESERWIRVPNPASLWIIQKRPDLAIVPIRSWKAARRKLAAIRAKCPITGKKRSRNALRPTTLLSGTRYCACCENNELKLYRSLTPIAPTNGVNQRDVRHWWLSALIDQDDQGD